MSEYPWIVVDSRDEKGKCRRCGEERALSLPKTVDEIVEFFDEFTEEHKDCEGPDPVDYRELLKRYLDRVGQSEGVFFLKRGFSDFQFTDQERRELNNLIDELKEDRRERMG